MKALKIVAALAMVAGTQQVFAASPATGNLSVDATLVSSCTVTSPTLSFGTTIDPLTLASGTADAQVDISVTCSQDTSYTIALGAGNGASATETARKMTHTTDATSILNYALYNDSGRTQNWGTTTGAVTGTGTGSATAHTVYGSILSGQSGATLGAYSDTVTITVSY